MKGYGKASDGKILKKAQSWGEGIDYLHDTQAN